MLLDMAVIERLLAGQMDLLVAVIIHVLGEGFWQRTGVKWPGGMILIWKLFGALGDLYDSPLPM
jgi:hypothetical protein